MMADIAAIFHWTPDQLARLTLPELIHWRGLAVERWNKMHGGKG